MERIGRIKGQGTSDGTRPCSDYAALRVADAFFVRVAGRLADLVQISAGEAASCTFDALLCAVSAGDVAKWHSRLEPGQWAAFSFYGTKVFEPLQSLYLARARRHGVVLPQAGALPWQRVSDAESARSLLREIGLREVRVYAEQLGYYLSSAGDWWDIVSSSGLGSLAAQLPAGQWERLKAEHLAEVAALADGGPFWLDVPAIFGMGREPRE